MAGIDTVWLTLWRDAYGGGFEHIPQLLDSCEPRAGNDGGPGYCFGYLGNLRVTVSEYKVKVEGSLPKWLRGDNLQTLTRGAVMEAIEKLSDYLQVPMERAQVGRVDIGANFITRDPAPMYFKYYRDLARHDRILSKNQLLFKSAGRQFAFYDKIQEVRKNRCEIPPIYQGRNVLRVEKRTLRITKETAAQFGMVRLLGRTLYDEGCYVAMMKDYKATYDSIIKMKACETDKTNMEMKTLKDFKMAGQLLVIQQMGGMKEFAMEMDARAAAGKISRQQKCKLMAAAKEAIDYAKGITTVDSGFAELDALIKKDLAFFP